MNKSRVSKRFSKCNLKQTDIFTCFRNWQSFERDKKKRKMALSSEVIVVGDSDSESTTTNPDNNWPKKKRPLAEPFSEEDDNNEDIMTTLPLKPIQTNILPKIKRPLSHGFSDEENVEYKKLDAGSGDAATPKIKETVMNNKNNSLNHPLACSTPLPASNLDTANTLGNHIGYAEALQISQIDSNNISDSCSVSSIDSEQTIILDQSSLIKNNITVQENLIIATSYTNNVTKAVSPHSSNSKNTVGPSKRGCVEQEKDRKKLKIVHENSSCGSNVPSVSKENKSSLEMSHGNSTCGRPFGIEPTRTSTADDKMDASREVGKKVSKSTGKWLSKKNKSDCDSNQRKILNSGEEARKNIKTSDRNTCDIREKSGSSKKSPQTHKNSIKVPSKENMPNRSKNLENNSNDGSSKTSSGQSHVERDKNSTSVKVAKSGSSPKKGGNVTGLSSDKSFKAKKEEKKMNKEPLLLITELFKTVFSSRHVNNLCETEREAITTFFDMDFRYQYACLKLITRQTKWYNIYKFCSLIYLEMEDTDISDMVKFFERKGIVDTVYTEESAEHLLSRLNNTEIRGICDKFRLKKTLKMKDEMIKHLLKYSNNQCTLTVHKTTKDLLMDEIQRRLGRCMRVSKDFQDAFYSIYTLSTYTNPRFSSMKDYFNSMLYLKVQVPDFNINDYIIFNSRNDFIRYLEAKKYRDELENCKNHLEGLQICETVFVNLKALENHNSDDETFQNAPHLVRFTARAVYVSSLSSMANTLFAKFPYQVKTWLEYMIKKVDFPHKIGNWYYHLIWLYMKYLKPFNYDRAAELLVEVLHRKGEHLSEVQLYRLRERGKQLLSTRKYKILQMNHDLIVHLLPKRIKVEEFPEETIDAKAIRSNLPQKRNYEVRNGEGNKIIYKVEGIALEHYLDHGYTGGEHCEGAFVLATFTLFFFDIIYKPRDVIPGTFVSKIQSEPLDMNSRYFYSNRREQIDRRLREIESEWSDAQVLKFLRDNYEKHSHEFAVCEVGMIIKDESLLKVLVECAGRKIWAKIYERLVKNFREYRSGLPDLLVWNEHKKYCKFVEVKGENDKLSVGQKLWLDYLRKIGAQIEVCHVHSIGSKRKMKKVGDKDLQEASTSSSSSSEKVP